MRHLLKVAALAALALAASASQAQAAATVRVEWMKGGFLYSSEKLSTSGASVQSTAAPNFGGVGGQAVIKVMSGAVIVTMPGANPTATEFNGIRLQTCSDPLTLPASAGLKIAVIEAVDPVSCSSVSIGNISAGDASAAKQDALQAAFGLVGDNAWSGTGNGTSIAIQKYIAGKEEAIRGLLAGTLTVTGPLTNAQASALGLALHSDVDGLEAQVADLQAKVGGVSDIYDGTNGKTLMGYARASADVAINPAAASVAPKAQTTGGCTPYGYASAASTNSTLISTGAHTLCVLAFVNTTSTLYYYRAYNTSSAPTCSSATGWLFSVPIPANTTGAGIAVPLGPFGMDFPTGLSFCLTGGGGSTDSTNAATGVTVIAAYK